MPGCVLRIGGNFTAAELLTQCPLPRVTRADDGCVLVLVSDSEGSDLQAQIAEASEFLSAFNGALQKVLSSLGLRMELDFGVWLKEGPIQSLRFPAALTRVAGNLGIVLVITAYESQAGED